MQSEHLALGRFPFVETRSLDEAVSLQSRLTTPLQARQLDLRMPFEWRANRVMVGAMAVMASQYQAAVHTRTENVEGLYSLMVPFASSGRVQQSGRPIDVVSGRNAALLSPHLPAEIVLRSGYRGILVVISSQVMEGTLDALTGVARKTPLRFEGEVDTTGGAGASSLRLLDFILAEADRDDGVLHAPLLQSKLADSFICSLLLGQPHNHSHLLHRPERSVEPACVRRAEEYIAANVQKPINIRDLAAVSGVGARTLFAAFRAHRGCAPMAFLRNRRFELARSRLMAPSAATVAEIALSCGFEHLGRFSIGYRQRFGESPTQTLRAGRSGRAR